MEWNYIDNYLTNALMNLLGSIWAGDRVYVVGDYADLTAEPDAVWVPALKEVYDMFGLDEKERNLYGYASDNFDRIKPFEKIENPFWGTLDESEDDKIAIAKVSITNGGAQYIYNHAKKVYINLAHCPIKGTWESETEIGVNQLHPLPILLAMGNVQGGGDFWNDPHGYAGSWCVDARDIRVSASLIPGTEDYQEFKPDFTGVVDGDPVSWDKKDAFLEAFKVMKPERSNKKIV